MTLQEVREKYLEFFRKRGHTIIPSASLVPENDPTTLFTGSGMQPLVPYLLGEKHSQGNRLANSQKCFRTVDIEEVGDNRHTTFFEMLGNWSFGDYFKKEQIEWMFLFLTEEIGIDPHRLFITVFAGDEKNNISKDIEAANLWKSLFSGKGVEAGEVEIGSEENGYKVGMQGGRIFYYDAKKNWWSRAGVPENMPAGEPGGPDSEMFYEFKDVPHNTKFGIYCHPNCDCGRFLEIGNNVFMEYRKNADGTFSKLPKSNVDFGGGLERLVMATENCADTIRANHRPILDYIEKVSGKKYGSDPEETRNFRIIADHMKASVFLIADGVTPSNTDQGYYVRRLLRRAVRLSDFLGITEGVLSEIVDIVALMYKDSYPAILSDVKKIKNEISNEEAKFREAYKQAMKAFESYAGISVDGLGTKIPTAEKVFELITSHGLSKDIIEKELVKRGIEINWERVEDKLKRHRELSRSGSEKKFKGGLADTSEMSVKYHTATHLLHQALRDVLGAEVRQKGSNITPERLRFDFSFPRKMTEDEKKCVEEIVNKKIRAALPVQKTVLPLAEAEKTGALHFFGDLPDGKAGKYGEQVNVYYIGDSLPHAYSKEFCGGPHVTNTRELLGTFKIVKEEAVSQGVRRIKAVLE